ncbi:hypothetical protein [Jatrophihabitans fulvus]
MARLRSLEAGKQNVRVHPSEADDFYQVVAGRDGKRYLHLSTFGSDDRKSEPKSSQSIQVDDAMAGELVAVLRKVFPEIP